jgi:hypothetical protein
MSFSLIIEVLILSLAFPSRVTSVKTSPDISEHINIIKNGNILSYV